MRCGAVRCAQVSRDATAGMGMQRLSSCSSRPSLACSLTWHIVVTSPVLEGQQMLRAAPVVCAPQRVARQPAVSHACAWKQPAYPPLRAARCLQAHFA